MAGRGEEQAGRPDLLARHLDKLRRCPRSLSDFPLPLEPGDIGSKSLDFSFSVLFSPNDIQPLPSDAERDPWCSESKFNGEPGYPRAWHLKTELFFWLLLSLLL